MLRLNYVHVNSEMLLADPGEDLGKLERGRRCEAAHGEVANQRLARVGGNVGEFLAVGKEGPKLRVERATRAGQGQAVPVVTAVILPYSTAAAK